MVVKVGVQPKARGPGGSPEMLGTLRSFHKPTLGPWLCRRRRVSLGTDQGGDSDADPGFETVGWNSELGRRRK